MGRVVVHKVTRSHCGGSWRRSTGVRTFGDVLSPIIGWLSLRQSQSFVALFPSEDDFTACRGKVLHHNLEERSLI